MGTDLAHIVVVAPGSRYTAVVSFAVREEHAALRRFETLDRGSPVTLERQAALRERLVEILVAEAATVVLVEQPTRKRSTPGVVAALEAAHDAARAYGVPAREVVLRDAIVAACGGLRPRTFHLASAIVAEHHPRVSQWLPSKTGALRDRQQYRRCAFAAAVIGFAETLRY